jgi:hypothetical protein
VKASVLAKELDICSERLPGDVEDDMLGRIEQGKHGTARGLPRRSRTAKVSHISRHAMKLGCAREWGGCGRLSVDGPGQQNPDRSEGPWRRATKLLAWRCSTEQVASDVERRTHAAAESTKDGGKPNHVTGMLGASLTETRSGQALSDMPALEPY